MTQQSNNLPTGSPRAADHLDSLSPYIPGMSIDELAKSSDLAEDDIIKLASNENPRGPSPSVLAVTGKAARTANRYPDVDDLVHKLAATWQVEPEQIVVGNGSNDVLDLIARAYLNPGDTTISSQYAFFVYSLVTKLAGGLNTIVPSVDFGHDLAAMQKAITDTTKIIWIANPNNPTGTFIGFDRIKQFVQSISKQIIVIDEAYFEYLSGTDTYPSHELMAINQNVILTRTFSKVYGLAGYRIGYAVASPKVACLLNSIRQPFNANSLALAAALAALNDRAYVAESAALNDTDRRYLAEQLAARGLSYIPSRGNFITIAFADSAKVHAHLLSKGIIVRLLSNYDLDGYLRVSVGTRAELDAFLDAIEIFA